MQETAAIEIVARRVGIQPSGVARLQNDRMAVLLLAVLAGAYAKDAADAGNEPEATMLYRLRRTIITRALRLSPPGTWSLVPHQYVRPGVVLQGEQRPAQTLIQIRTIHQAFSFHELEDVEAVARRLYDQEGISTTQALHTPAEPWDGVPLQPFAEQLLDAYLCAGVEGFAREKAAIRVATSH